MEKIIRPRTKQTFRREVCFVRSLRRSQSIARNGFRSRFIDGEPINKIVEKAGRWFAVGRWEIGDPVISDKSAVNFTMLTTRLFFFEGTPILFCAQETLLVTSDSCKF